MNEHRLQALARLLELQKLNKAIARKNRQIAKLRIELMRAERIIDIVAGSDDPFAGRRLCIQHRDVSTAILAHVPIRRVPRHVPRVDADLSKYSGPPVIHPPTRGRSNGKGET